MLEFIFGPANSGKSTAVYERIAKKLLSGNGSVVLMVPEQNSFESERAILKYLSSGFSQKIEVLTFSRLSELVAREAGGIAGVPIEDSGRLIAMGQTLGMLKHTLTYYNKQTESPEFIRSVLNMIQEFKQSGMSADEIMQLSEELPEGSLKLKTHDFALILSQYTELVLKRHIDTDDSLSILYETLAEYAFFEGKSVFFDSFFGFTGQQFKIIDRIFKWTEDVCFSLPGDSQNDTWDGFGTFSNIQKTAAKLVRLAGAHGIKTAKAEILDTAYFDNQALTALEKGFRLGDTVFSDNTEAVTIASLGNIYDEMDYVAGTIHRIVRENPGIRYKDFVVIARDINLYKNAAEIMFSRYDVPIFMDERRNAATFPVMICVMSAFRAAMTFSGDEIFKWLKTGLSPLTYEQIAALENYTYIWGISSEDWKKVFDKNPAGFSDLQNTEDFSEQLAELNVFRDAVITPLLELKDAMTSGSGLKISKGIYQFLLDTAVPDKLKAMAGRAEDSGDVETAELFRGSYDLLMNILSGMAVGFGEEKISAEKFYKMLCMVISGETLGAIPQKLDTVVAGSAEKIRPARPRYTFIVGFNQGAFPRISSGGLLNARERTALTDLGIAIKDCYLGSSVEESYLLYRTLFSCYSKLFISYVRTSAGGDSLMPSSYVRQITNILPNCKKIVIDSGTSPEAKDFETAESALGMLAANWESESEDIRTLKQYFSRSDKYSHRLHTITRGIYDVPERLSADIAKKFFGENIVLSASKLDTFARCRFSYFCKYGLGAKPLRKAELDVMQRGTVAHYVLEQLIMKYKGALKNTTAEERQVDVSRFIDEYTALMLGGKPIEDYRLLFLLERMRVLLCELADRIFEELTVSEFVPEYCELSIGFDENASVKPLKIPLEYGNAWVIGSVDRVDVMEYEDKLVFRVIDYKTGTKKFSLPDIVHGLNMQMLIYLFAIRTGGIKNIGKELSPAGILYVPAKRAIASEQGGERDAETAVRMNGLLVNDTDYLTAMNKEKDGRFVPVRFTKSGTPYKSSSLITACEFDIIEKHIRNYIKNMCDLLHEGDIAVSPVDGVSSNACEYCDYATVCLKRENAERTEAAKMSNEAVLELLKKEAGEDGVPTDERAV